jgi:hypothetical protein
MPVEFRKRITRSMLRAEPDALFVFGDCIAGWGLGGQAKEMRGEPNAVGIPTKWKPYMTPEAFFRDEDLPIVKERIVAPFDRLHQQLARFGKVVLPADGIGTGLARLDQHAPAIKRLIDLEIEGLVTASRHYDDLLPKTHSTHGECTGQATVEKKT